MSGTAVDSRQRPFARVRREGDPLGPPEVAIATIFVDGHDIDNLTLAGSAGGKVSGRVIVEDDAPPKMSSVLVAVRQLLRNQPRPVVLGLQRSNREPGVKEDGTFVAENVFGRARFQVTLPDGWMLKAVTHQGRDIRVSGSSQAGRAEDHDR